LREHLTFLGDLSETQMCERYLKSHNFVSGFHYWKFSKFSGARAMILGLPVAASECCGVRYVTPSFWVLLYQSDFPNLLAHYGVFCEKFNWCTNLPIRRILWMRINHANQYHNIINNVNILTGSIIRKISTSGGKWTRKIFSYSCVWHIIRGGRI